MIGTRSSARSPAVALTEHPRLSDDVLFDLASPLYRRAVAASNSRTAAGSSSTATTRMNHEGHPGRRRRETSPDSAPAQDRPRRLALALNAGLLDLRGCKGLERVVQDERKVQNVGSWRRRPLRGSSISHRFGLKVTHSGPDTATEAAARREIDANRRERDELIQQLLVNSGCLPRISRRLAMTCGRPRELGKHLSTPNELSLERP